jgi:hypothetical protein
MNDDLILKKLKKIFNECEKNIVRINTSSTKMKVNIPFR